MERFTGLTSLLEDKIGRVLIHLRYEQDGHGGESPLVLERKEVVSEPAVLPAAEEALLPPLFVTQESIIFKHVTAPSESGNSVRSVFQFAQYILRVLLTLCLVEWLRVEVQYTFLLTTMFCRDGLIFAEYTFSLVTMFC